MPSGNPSPLFRSGYKGNVYRRKRRSWQALLRPLLALVVLAVIVGAFYATYRIGRNHPKVSVATGVVASNSANTATISAGGRSYSVADNVAWFAAGATQASAQGRATCLTTGQKLSFGWISVPKLGQRVVLWVRC